MFKKQSSSIRWPDQSLQHEGWAPFKAQNWRSKPSSESVQHAEAFTAWYKADLLWFLYSHLNGTHHHGDWCWNHNQLQSRSCFTSFWISLLGWCFSTVGPQSLRAAGPEWITWISIRAVRLGSSISEMVVTNIGALQGTVLSPSTLTSRVGLRFVTGRNTDSSDTCKRSSFHSRCWRSAPETMERRWRERWRRPVVQISDLNKLHRSVQLLRLKPIRPTLHETGKSER